jgi:hypothetical protein
MFSFTRGKDIALITEGKMKGKYLKLYGENHFGEPLEPDLTIYKSLYSSLLDKDFYKNEGISRYDISNFNDMVDGKKDIPDDIVIRERIENAHKFVHNELRTRLMFTDNTKLFPYPPIVSQRIYVSGPSGSGKSTFISEYIDLMQKMKGGKKKKVYIFSRVPDDEPLDKLKKVIRIPLEMDFLNKHPLKVEEFKGDILVFDDIDTLLNKDISIYLRAFRDDVLETGRHWDITTLSTSHLPSDYQKTRTVINEGSAIVLFPRGMTAGSLHGFLERYLGMNKKQISYIESLPTRWVWFYKDYPKYAIHERGAFLY